MKQLFSPKIYLMVMFFCITLTSNAVTKKMGTYSFKITSLINPPILFRLMWHYNIDYERRNDTFDSFTTSYSLESFLNNPYFKQTSHEFLMSDDICFPRINFELRFQSFRDVDRSLWYDEPFEDEEELKKTFNKYTNCIITRNRTNMQLYTLTEISVNYSNESNDVQRAHITYECRLNQRALLLEDEIIQFLNPTRPQLKDMFFLFTNP